MNINLLKQLGILLLISSSVIACAPKKIAQIQAPAIKILTAIGYGTSDIFKNYSPEQRRLMSMRASKMDAYRNLAEQIYGVRIHGHTTVSDMVVQNDSYRSYLDAFIKGARVKSITAINASSYETVLEITLTPKFFTCLSGSTAIYNQCFNGGRHGYDSEHINPQLNMASTLAYSCNAIDCYKYPDVSGFYNKEF